MAILRLGVDTSGLSSGVNQFKKSTDEMAKAVHVFGAGLVNVESQINKVDAAAARLDVSQAVSSVKQLLQGGMAIADAYKSAEKALDSYANTAKAVESSVSTGGSKIITLAQHAAENVAKLRESILGTSEEARKAEAPIVAYGASMLALANKSAEAAKQLGTIAASMSTFASETLKVGFKPTDELEKAADRLPYSANQIKNAFKSLSNELTGFKQPVIQTARYLLGIDDATKKVTPTLKQLREAISQGIKDLKWQDQLAKATNILEAFRAQADKAAFAVHKMREAERAGREETVAFGTGVFDASQKLSNFGANLFSNDERIKAGVPTLASASKYVQELTLNLQKQAKAAEQDTLAWEKYLATVDRAKFAAFQAGTIRNQQAQQVRAPFGAGIDRLDEVRGGGRGSFFQFGAGIDKTVEQTTKKTHDLDAALRGVNRRTFEFAKSAGEASKGLHEMAFFGGSAKSIISQLFLGFSAVFAIREGLRATTATLGEFDKALQTISAVGHVTGNQLATVEKNIRQFGATSTYGAKQTAIAFESLIKAGLSVEESTNALPQTLNFATVAQVSLAEAAETTSKVLRQFNLNSKQTERAMDALTVVSNSTVTSVGPLGEALKNVGPIASDLGNEIEDVTAALGVLAERGNQGGSAGTRLRGLLLALTNPTAEAVEAIENLRSTLDGSRLSMEQLDPRVNNLSKIFKVLGQSNFDAATAAILFNDRFAASGLVLAKGSERLEELIQLQKQLRGETQRNADTINSSLSKAYDRFKAAIEELILATGDAGLRGALRGIVDFSTQVILSLAGFDDPARKVALSAKLVADAVTALTVAATGFISVKIITFMVQARFGLTALMATVDAVRASWIALAEAQTAANAAAATSALGTALAIAAGAAVLLYTAFNDLSDSADEYTNAIEKSRSAVDKLIVSHAKLERAQKTRALTDQLDALQASSEALSEVIKKNEEDLDLYFNQLDQYLAKGTYGDRPIPPVELKFEDLDVFVAGTVKAKEALDKAREGLAEYEKTRQSLINSNDQWLGGLDIKDFVDVSPIDVLNIALTETKDKIFEVRKALSDNPEAREAGAAYLDAKSKLDKLIDSLNLEAEIAEKTAGLSEDAAKDLAERIRIQHEIRSSAAGAEIDQLDELLAKYDQQIVAAQTLVRTRKEENATIRERENALKIFEHELELLKNRAQVSSEDYDARKKEAEVLRLSMLARAAGITLTVEQANEVRRLVGVVEDATEAHKMEGSALRERSSLLSKSIAAMRQMIDQERKAQQTAETFVSSYAALANSINDSIEVQTKATVLARFDAIAKDRQTEAFKKLRKELEGYLDTIAAGENTAAARGIEELIRKYENQADALKETSGQHRRSTAMLELENVARGHAVNNLDEYIDRLNTALDLITELEEKGRDKQAQDIVRGLEEELLLLKSSNDEREKRVRLYELENLLAQGPIDKVEETRAAIIRLSDAIAKERKIKDLADDIAGPLGGAIQELVVGARTASEVFRALGQDILNALFFNIVTKPLTNAFSSGLQDFFGGLFSSPVYGPPAPSYMGNVFENGDIRRLAAGGIVDTPAYFALRGGQIGSIAERGPEGVMPLGRNSKGELGVKVADYGGGGSTVINMTINAQDADSFRRSSPQIVADLKRRMRG